jgi:hypothetical protein
MSKRALGDTYAPATLSVPSRAFSIQQSRGRRGDQVYDIKGADPLPARGSGSHRATPMPLRGSATWREFASRCQGCAFLFLKNRNLAAVY